jgi:hypothetical protein
MLDILLAIWTLICEEDQTTRCATGPGLVVALLGVWRAGKVSETVTRHRFGLFLESVKQESRDKMGQGTSMFFCKKSDRNGFLTLRYHLWREAYVPLEPSFPPQRLRFMLEDSQVPWNILERFGRWRIWFRCGKIKWEAACMILCVFPTKES